jgi:hypothetical protein
MTSVWDRGSKLDVPTTRTTYDCEEQAQLSRTSTNNSSCLALTLSFVLDNDPHMVIGRDENGSDTDGYH